MKRRNFNTEFKRETAKYIIDNGISIGEAQRKFGVGSTALRRWCVEYREDPEQAFPGKGRLRADEEQIRQLKNENTRLRQERDILKKATVFFAKETK